ncbi:MAG TPA: hypothetical protein P5080_05915 [Candidatus Paceibacterota bacterium]|nr:hypothetical protein [Candidatus Pacearchaeota archaeon]HRZ51455.1 hypothetical protein [Candidatus Paceibacterota bacterium]HSA37203.1 hypothetical protein [Candidatus Paceibacterota bacterium]
MNTGYPNDKKGFIALISAIMVSAVLMVVVAAVSAASFNTRLNVFDQQNKKAGEALAKACVQRILAEAVKSSRYETVYEKTGSETAGEGGTCRFCARKGPNSLEFLIGIRAEYAGTYTNLNITAIMDKAEKNFSIISWKEDQTYSGSCVVP